MPESVIQRWLHRMLNITCRHPLRDIRGRFSYCFDWAYLAYLVLHLNSTTYPLHANRLKDALLTLCLLWNQRQSFGLTVETKLHTTGASQSQGYFLRTTGPWMFLAFWENKEWRKKRVPKLSFTVFGASQTLEYFFHRLWWQTILWIQLFEGLSLTSRSSYSLGG